MNDSPGRDFKPPHLPDGADGHAAAARACKRWVGQYGMSRYRSIQATRPAQLVVGFGNTGVRASEDGITTIGHYCADQLNMTSKRGDRPSGGQ